MFDIFPIENQNEFIEEFKKKYFLKNCGKNVLIKDGALKIQINEKEINLYCIAIYNEENIIFTMKTKANLELKIDSIKDSIESKLSEIFESININKYEFTLINENKQNNAKQINEENTNEAIIKASEIIFKKIAFEILKENKNAILCIKVINAESKIKAKKEALAIGKYILDSNIKFKHPKDYINSIKAYAGSERRIKILLCGKVIYENNTMHNEAFINKIMKNTSELNLTFDYGYDSCNSENRFNSYINYSFID